MTPPPSPLLEYCSVWETYIFSHSTITWGWILQIEVSKNPINLPNIMGSLASSAFVSLVAKNGTKKSSQPFKDGFWC